MASDDDGQSSCRNVRGGRRFCSAFFLRYTNTASTAGALCSAAELWPCRHTVCAAATMAGALQSQSKVIILISLFVPIVELMPKCNNLSLYAFQDKEARHRNGQQICLEGQTKRWVLEIHNKMFTATLIVLLSGKKCICCVKHVQVC